VASGLPDLNYCEEVSCGANNQSISQPVCMLFIYLFISSKCRYRCMVK